MRAMGTPGGKLVAHFGIVILDEVFCEVATETQAKNRTLAPRFLRHGAPPDEAETVVVSYEFSGIAPAVAGA